MGCSSSKVEDLPLVTLCRERADFLKAASQHRYEFASAHDSYFRSLRDVGSSLKRFVDEELLIEDSSPNLPNTHKPLMKKNLSSPSSLSHSVSFSHKDYPWQREECEECAECSNMHFSSGEDDEHGEPHLHFSSGSEDEVNSCLFEDHNVEFEAVTHHKVRRKSNAHYMKRSSVPISSVIFQEPEHLSVGYGDSSNFDSNHAYYPHQEVPAGSMQPNFISKKERPQPLEPPDPPTPSPNISPWDFLNPFISYDNGYAEYSKFRYGYGSLTSTPDSKEVREREGIPELEEETEHEILKEVDNENKLNKNQEHGRSLNGFAHQQKPFNNQEIGSSSTSEEDMSAQSEIFNQPEMHQVKPQNNDVKSLRRSSKKVKQQTQSFRREHIKRSPDSFAGKVLPDESSWAKGIHYRTYTPINDDDTSSESKTSPTFSKHVPRDFIGIMKDIKNEFDVASTVGKDVASMLEVGKHPYKSKATLPKVMSSIVPCLPSSQSAIDPTRPVSSTTKAYKKCSMDPSDNARVSNLSSTLEKLYMWEKKLYKEVKDEERFRVMYEKQFRKLKILDDRGAEASKIDLTEASVRKLLTRIDISFRRIQSISTNIHRLRDEELQPQLTALLNGLSKMWARMLKSHKKQFNAITDNIGRVIIRKDSNFQRCIDLEIVILKWYANFDNWIRAQKSYVQSLNEWLMRLLLHEPEETSDGISPFSPTLAGAPPIFSICNDWCQAVERVAANAIAGTAIADTLNDFARSLHRLREVHQEEQRQRLKEESVATDFAKSMEPPFGHDRSSEVKPIDVNEMKQKLHDERTKHEEVMKLVQKAASSSIPGGLVPIFESLVNFSAEAHEAYRQVRIWRSETVS